MPRIKIKDLPKDRKISKEEMKKVIGGFNPQPEPPGRFFYPLKFGFGQIGTLTYNSGVITYT
jgi:hypothetical protein